MGAKRKRYWRRALQFINWGWVDMSPKTRRPRKRLQALWKKTLEVGIEIHYGVRFIEELFPHPKAKEYLWDLPPRWKNYLRECTSRHRANLRNKAEGVAERAAEEKWRREQEDEQ